MRPLTLKNMIKQLSFHFDPLKDILSKSIFAISKECFIEGPNHWSLVLLDKYL